MAVLNYSQVIKHTYRRAGFDNASMFVSFITSLSAQRTERENSGK